HCCEAVKLGMTHELSASRQTNMREFFGLNSAYGFFGVRSQTCLTWARSRPAGENSAISFPRRPRICTLKIWAPSNWRVVPLSMERKRSRIQFQPWVSCELSTRTMTSIWGWPQNPGRFGAPRRMPGLNSADVYLPLLQLISIRGL